MTKPLRRGILTEELYALTNDDLSAVILRQFIYWVPRMHDTDRYLVEEQARQAHDSDDSEASLTQGWIYKSTKEMKHEILTSRSEDTVAGRIARLIEAGWLQRRNNPKYKWDHTYQYRVNLRAIEKNLRALGYTLATVMSEDYPLVQHVFSESIPNGAESVPNDAESIPSDAETIPEITIESRTEKDPSPSHSAAEPAFTGGTPKRLHKSAQAKNRGKRKSGLGGKKKSKEKTSDVVAIPEANPPLCPGCGVPEQHWHRLSTGEEWYNHKLSSGGFCESYPIETLRPVKGRVKKLIFDPYGTNDRVEWIDD